MSSTQNLKKRGEESRCNAAWPMDETQGIRYGTWALCSELELRLENRLDWSGDGSVYDACLDELQNVSPQEAH